jgi:HPt (histidine-containing phosphotransfer) domain-containing protein
VIVGSVPTLDNKIFDELAALGDAIGEGFLVGLVDQFFSETEPLLVGLSQAISSDDAHSTRRLAHNLKGSSAQLGGLRFASCCDRLEKLATSGDLAGLRVELREVETDYRALCVLLRQRVSAPRPSEVTS